MRLIKETKGYVKLSKKIPYKLPSTKMGIVLLVIMVGLFGALVAVLGWQALAEPPNNFSPVSFVETQPSKKGATDDPTGTIVLGKPTDTSITANIIPGQDWEVVLQYGVKSQNPLSFTEPHKSQNGQPIVIDINGLKPSTQYFYKMGYRTNNNQAYQMGQEHKFYTARNSGESFVFAVQSDTHFDINNNDLYKVTAKNILSSNPDFIIDLGDKLMSGNYAKNYVKTQEAYKKPRYYMSLVGNSAPVYLVNGNHDGENGWLSKQSPDNITIWATQVRKLLFPNPYPNYFYGGDSIADPNVGLRGSYFSWQWGDALFIVLDSLWNTKESSGTNNNDDIWAMTIGNEQYKWLKQTLETSSSKYKFVFTHHILGSTMHGGIYWSQFGEWGGNNLDGGWNFEAQRPGWSKTIRKLLEDNKVSIIFQGHDHVFGKEDLNGVVYQEVPQPNSLYGQSWVDREFTYAGTTLPSSGYVRVSVGPAETKVDYVKSNTPSQETKKQRNADITYSYKIYPSY